MFNLHFTRHTGALWTVVRVRKRKSRPVFGSDHIGHQFRSMWIRHIFLLSSWYSLQFLWIHKLIIGQICDSQHGVHRITIRKKYIKYSRNRKSHTSHSHTSTSLLHWQIGPSEKQLSRVTCMLRMFLQTSQVLHKTAFTFKKEKKNLFQKKSYDAFLSECLVS